eukprot:gene11547-biopygen333
MPYQCLTNAHQMPCNTAVIPCTSKGNCLPLGGAAHKQLVLLAAHGANEYFAYKLKRLKSAADWGHPGSKDIRFDATKYVSSWCAPAPGVECSLVAPEKVGFRIGFMSAAPPSTRRTGSLNRNNSDVNTLCTARNIPNTNMFMCTPAIRTFITESSPSCSLEHRGRAQGGITMSR